MRKPSPTLWTAKESSHRNPGKARRGRRAVLPPVLVALSGLIAAALSFTIWNRYFDQASPSVPSTSCPQIVQPTGHPPLVSPGIRRVALIGDSIMAQASSAVADSLASVGIETARYAVPGTGLLSGSVDWVKTTGLIMAGEHPDAVIAIFVGNYFPPTGKDRVLRDGPPQQSCLLCRVAASAPSSSPTKCAPEAPRCTG